MKKIESTHRNGASVSVAHLHGWRVADIERLIRSVMAVLIGLGRTCLFAVVVLVILFVAVTKADGQAGSLLNTVLALVATTLSGVTGYAFGRHTSRGR